MKKLQLKNVGLNKVSLTNGTTHNLGILKLDLEQFLLPKKFVMLKSEMAVKIDKAKNMLGELDETGTYTITFKVYDRSLVEMALANDLSAYGAPIDVVLEKVETIPNLDKFEEIDFIPIKFEGLQVRPLRVERKVYSNGQSASSWQFADVRVYVTDYKIED